MALDTNALFNKYKNILSGGVNKLSSFVRENPTPAGFISKNVPQVNQNLQRLRNVDIASTLAGGAAKSYLDTRNLSPINPQRIVSQSFPVFGAVKNVLSAKPTFFSEQVKRAVPGNAGTALGLLGEIALPGIGGELSMAKGLKGVAKSALKSVPVGMAYGLSGAETLKDVPMALARGGLFAGTLGAGSNLLSKAYGVNPNMKLYGGKTAKEFPTTGEGTFSSLADKKIRFEIPDNLSKVIIPKDLKEGVTYALNKIFGHDILYKNYPDIGKVPVTVAKLNGAQGQFDGSVIALDSQFMQHPSAYNVAKISTPKGSLSIDLTGYTNVKDKIRSVILHEVQHVIQDKEGFAQGGSTNSFQAIGKEWYQATRKRIDLEKRVQQIAKDFYSKNPINYETVRKFEQIPEVKEIRKAFDEVDKLLKPTENPYSSYKKLSGEVESRDVQSRMNLTPGQRASTLPYQSQGIPVNEQIVRYEKGAPSQMVDFTAPVGKEFKTPYKKGDITKIEEALDDLLGTKSFMHGDWKSKMPARRTAFEQLETYAKQGDEEAMSLLEQARGLEKSLVEAQSVKNAPVTKVKPIKQTEVPETKPAENTYLNVTKASSQVEKDLSQMSQTPPPTGGKGPPKTPPSSKAPSETIVSDTFNINTKNLKLNNEQVKTLKTSIDNIKPALEEIKGKTLTNDEIVKAAKTSDMLTGVVNRADTMAAEAQILKARQQLVSLDKEIEMMQKSGNVAGAQRKMAELVESIKSVSGIAADTGRKLQSFSIGAKDESLRQQILKEILKTDADTKTVIDRAGKINWDDARQVVKFYREFIKPSITDVLTEYRYNNMLSNPRTHLRNAFSNVIQTYVTRPATLAFQGDIKGAAQYYKGVTTSLPDAANAFMKSFRGETMPSAKYEVTKMGTTKLPRFFTIPSRAMEAADKFFSTLITGGEMARGLDEKAAKQIAQYSVFRSDLFPEGQGHLLNAIDTFTNGLYKLRKVPGGDWFVPFLRTPMNVAKQWIEYSPLGVGTIPGSNNAKEQLAKSLIGSVVTAVGAKLAFDGLTTWATPTDPKQKQYFYDTGRKPFSININGNWVPMSTFGIYAFPLALPAAMKYFRDESRTALTDTDIDKISRIIPGMLNFWSSQTPLSGLGGFVRTLQGDIDYSIAKNLGFTASQIIPFQALVRYLTTAIDPIYRKTSGPIEQIQSTLPFASMKLEPYTDSAGNLSRRNISDYVAPYSIGKANPEYEDLYKMRGEKLQMNAVKNKMEKDLEKQLNMNTGLGVQAAEETQPTGQSFIETERAKMQEELAKEKFKISGQKTASFGNKLWIRDGDSIKTIDTSVDNPNIEIAKVDVKNGAEAQMVDDTYVYKEGDSVKTIDTTFEPQKPELTGQTELDKKLVSKYKGQVTSKINDIVKLTELGVYAPEEAEKMIKDIQSKTVSAGSGGRKAKKSITVKMPSLKVPKVTTSKIKKVTIPKPKRISLKKYSIKAPKLKASKLKKVARL